MMLMGDQVFYPRSGDTFLLASVRQEEFLCLRFVCEFRSCPRVSSELANGRLMPLFIAGT